MQRAAGVEPIGMRRDAAHRMDRYRPPAHRRMGSPGPIGPWHGDLDFFAERGRGDLGGESAEPGAWYVTTMPATSAPNTRPHVSDSSSTYAALTPRASPAPLD